MLSGAGAGEGREGRPGDRQRAPPLLRRRARPTTLTQAACALVQAAEWAATRGVEGEAAMEEDRASSELLISQNA